MIRSIFLFFTFLLSFSLFGQTANTEIKQEKKFAITGMYLQWGYNVAWYTRSNIHFKMNNGDHFTLHQARGSQRTSFDAIYKHPLDISIPQYNWRIGFYINKAKTRAIEINFDHTKYVVEDGQKLRVSGVLDGKEIDEYKVVTPENLLHFEHTDGANFLHINYVEQHSLRYSPLKQRNILTYLWKVGAGINIPRTDFEFRGDRLNNRFHIAGFNVSAEAGIRVYPTRTFFLELTGKSGYVNYLNALTDTENTKGNRANHHFGYVEFVGTVGGDIHFGNKKNKGNKL